MVWRVRLQPGSGEQAPRWLHLLIVPELQSETDWMMAARVPSDATHLYLDLDRRMKRRERFADHNPPPPLLPIVLYNGDGEWDVPVRYFDLRRPRAQRSLPGPGAQAPLAGVPCPDLRCMQGRRRSTCLHCA